ncbi:MAG TPA: 3-deoxy-8-phosphooctulonate synthase [Myxococcota bacterium]|nr:3-deoxy-8-phosphooctulonate synthase [Myxococcota bacterium]HRY95339.1 3-deoxy-8-phosphooctulonate synthase [Myxococcota bacterium]
MNPRVDLGPFAVGPGEPLVVFAGLCVLEDEGDAVALARDLRDRCAARGLPFVFKASFDKANRTSLESFRGPGLTRGLAMLRRVRAELGVPVLTDIHAPEQAEAAAEVVDVLQVPAFLCRQTDLLTAAGRTGKPVNLKKGQFLPPGDMRFAAEKVRAAGGRPLVCERGTSFGHGDLVVDLRSLVWLRAAGAPVLYDATHSVQQPGAGGHTGGLREMVAPLARAAVAVGVDGLYLEVHPQPDRAPSDARNTLDPEAFGGLLDQVIALRQALAGDRPR